MYVLARKRFLTSAGRDNRVPFHLLALLSPLPSLFAYPFSSYIILLIRGHASSNAQHFKHSQSNLTLGILSSSNGSLLSSPFLSYSYFSGERCFFNDHPSAVSIRAFHNNNLCRHIRSFDFFHIPFNWIYRRFRSYFDARDKTCRDLYHYRMNCHYGSGLRARHRAENTNVEKGINRG